jgi:hypothetical protein
MQKKVNSGWREGGEKVVIVIVNVKPREDRRGKPDGWEELSGGDGRVI